MAVRSPEWLTKREGKLVPNNTGQFWVAVLEGEPQFRLTPIPAGGKYGCEVIKTVNGQHIESPGIYVSREEAVQGGLEALRKSLGW